MPRNTPVHLSLKGYEQFGPYMHITGMKWVGYITEITVWALWKGRDFAVIEHKGEM